MNKLVRYLKKNCVLIFTLTIIILFVSIGCSYIVNTFYNLIEQNYYIGNTTISFQVNSFEKISYKELLEVLKQSNYNIFNTGMLGDSYLVHGIYLNKNLKIKPEMLDGRFFDKDDFTDDTLKLAVIGKGLLTRTISNGNDLYIKFNDEDYKVIGVMGNKNKQKMFDYVMMFNLNSLTEDSKYIKFDKNWILSSDSKEGAPSVIEKLNKILIKNDKDVSLTSIPLETQMNPLLTAFDKNKNKLSLFYILIISIFLNLVIIVQQWMDGLKKQIGVRKAFGAKNIDIYIMIFRNFVMNALIASAISILVHFILFLTGVLSYNNDITFVNFIIAALFSFIISIILLFFLVRQINRLQPDYIMRGR